MGLLAPAPKEASVCTTRPPRWMTSLSLALLCCAAVIMIGPRVLGSQAQTTPEAVRVWQDTLVLPTYDEGPPDPNPPFDLFVSGRFNYPYSMRTNLKGTSHPHAWRTLNLENEYLQCSVLPDLGGHLYRCRDKINGAELFYANPSIKYAQIGYRGAWAALGVEFNFPVSHNWMTTSPVDFATTTAADGSASVWIGNIDRPYGMQWRVELTLRPATAALEQHTVLYNRSTVRHRFYWWTNAAVEVWDDSRIIYPMTFTASHGFTDVDTWPVDRSGTDNSVVGNHTRGPVSRFSHGSREPYMAVYHPKTSSGIVHYSSPIDLPAKKIWSWGSNADGLDWRRALSDNNSAYVEIQAGLFRNQETYGFLEPQDSVQFTEHWIPIRDLDGVARANPDAVLNLTRIPEGPARTTLVVALNVTRRLPGATIEIANGAKVVARATAALTPSRTYRRSSAGLPAAATYTVTVTDARGQRLLAHTEGRYDLQPAEAITTGRQPAFSWPPPEQRSDGDWLALGTQQEMDGQRLVAWATYQEGLRRFPNSLALHKAAGRLAVSLKRFDEAMPLLEAVVARVSHDSEAWYYLGLARMMNHEIDAARLAWERSQAYGTFRAASMYELAALAARHGDMPAALQRLNRLLESSRTFVKAGEAEVALLRATGRITEARTRLAFWQRVDPTSTFLRLEATRLGKPDRGLLAHLAADPERIIEVAVAYMRLGLFGDAVDVLSRRYPAGSEVVSEVGMPRPESYPLIAYYRGYCQQAMGRSGGGDFAAASAMPTTYVFPNRPETLLVLRRALAENPSDATAHFLLGSLLLSGGMVEPAMAAWETARHLNPALPVLHRNMGYTVLRTGRDPERAIALFMEGTRADPGNAGLYFGLDEAMTQAGRPAADRVDALRRFPDQQAMPAALVFKLAEALAGAERFDEAERLFAGRFFPREEGGTNVRQVYVEVRVRRAQAHATRGECAPALDIVSHLGEAVPGLAFTRDGLGAFIGSPRVQQMIAQVRGLCAKRP